ncbi:MAG: DMT family transporter [Alphaproteobacteria bacterium]
MAPIAVPAVPAGVLLPIGLAALSAVGFAVLDATAKYLSTGLPALEVTWGRSAISGLIILALLGRGGWTELRRSPRVGLNLLRGLLAAGGAALAVYSVSVLPLALFTAIVFLYPVLVTVLSIPMLGERVGPRRWAAVLVGFAAIVVIVQPAGEGFGWLVALPLLCAVVAALYPVLTRLTAPGMSSLTQMAYGPGVAAILLTLVVPFVWVTPSWLDTLLLVLSGLLHGLCHWFVIRAFSAAPASVLAPFFYVQLPCAILAGYLVFDEVPSTTTLVGAAMLVAAGIYIAYREHRLSRSVRTPPLA